MDKHTGDYEYLGHLIAVDAYRLDQESRFTIQTRIRTPEGKFLPPLTDADQSFATLDEALDAGLATGKYVVQSQVSAL